MFLIPSASTCEYQHVFGYAIRSFYNDFKNTTSEALALLEFAEES